MTTYRVNEIFYSIQGEGRWAGSPTVFVRLSGCTRKCSFCDTDHSQYEEMNEYQLYGQIINIHPNPPRITFTGGEPLIYDLFPIVDLCRCKTTVETNGEGTSWPPGPTWVTLSPKSVDIKPRRADEYKFLSGVELPDWVDIISKFGKSRDCYLQPIHGPNYEVNLRSAIRFVKDHPELTLSLQLHKLIGVR